MEIVINQLGEITRRSIGHFIDNGCNTFSLEYDYYWEFLDQEQYDTIKLPVGHGAGQLYDDLKSIRDVLSGEMEPMGTALRQVAPLLRLLGEITSGIVPAATKHSSATPSSKVGLQELLSVTEMAITHLAEFDLETFVIKYDFFWDYSPLDRYNMLTDPPTPVIRRFTQDMQAIRAVLSGHQPVTALALVQVAPLLQLVGETEGW